ncbi:hypothetical protein GCM10023093_13710 [Nemorincola caseinilytica]|uniref:DUF3574 domain-containing protein n=1 Tax=Nemorincola caseinilytica TaxID=2054315 RepID=A0ABP8NCE5_9BACT
MRYFLLLVAICFYTGLAAQDTTYTRVELFFGLSDHGKKIPGRKWSAFVNEYITPAFPDGLTITNAYGQWREKDGAITRERSRVVTIICKKDAAATDRIDHIRKAYCERFHQSSVLEVDSRPSLISF